MSPVVQAPSPEHLTSTGTVSTTTSTPCVSLQDVQIISSTKEEGNEKRAIQAPNPVTLTITNAQRVHTTTLTLGNSFPSSFPYTSTPTPGLTGPKFVTVAKTKGNGQEHMKLTSRFWNGQTVTSTIPPASIVGIVVGVLGGLSLLMGVLYVYLLRARHLKSLRRKRRRKRRASTSAGGPGPPPPPPPPEAEAPPG